MANTGAPPPVVLIATVAEHSVAPMLGGSRYAATEVHSGTQALERARELGPDVVLLEADLPDMSGIDACRLLHADPRVGHNVPILILAPDKPSPEQRVAALRAGAWDFLRSPLTAAELSLNLEAYVQAKRSVDVALAAGLIDPATGLHSRPALARRARELGALLAREHGALACVVFALSTDPPVPKAGSLLVYTARLSDVVGVMSPTEFAVLAPATNHAGAVKLAERVGSALCRAVGDGAVLVPGSTLRAGYDAVGNLGYAPIDPAELLAHATAAVRVGQSEPDCPWVRRFEVTAVSGGDGVSVPRATPPGLVLENRRTSG